MRTAESVATDIQDKLHRMARSYNGTEGVRASWAQVAASTGLTPGQVKRLYYAEWLVIPAHVFLLINDAYRDYLNNAAKAADRAAKRAEHDLRIAQLLADEWDRKWPHG